MTSNSKIDELLTRVTTTLNMHEIEQKDHLILVCIIIITCFLVFYLMEFLNSKSHKIMIKNSGLWVFDKVFRVSKQINKSLTEFRKKIHEMKKIDIQPIYDQIPTLSDKCIEERVQKILEIDKVKEFIGKEGVNYFHDPKEGHVEFVCKMASEFMYTNIMHFDHCK